MNIEGQLDIDPDRLQEQFDRLHPVLMIAQDRRERGEASTYDVFKYKYEGKPLIDDMPEIIRWHPEFGHVNYDSMLLKSFSQRNLVVVRASKQLLHNVAQHYFVATADLEARTITEWQVAEVNFSWQNSHLQTELILSDGSDDKEPRLETVPVHYLDPLQLVLDGWQRSRELEKVRARRPRILLGQGCQFKSKNGEAEELAPLQQIHYGLQRFEEYAREAQRNTGELIIRQIVTKPATIVAA